MNKFIQLVSILFLCACGYSEANYKSLELLLENELQFSDLEKYQTVVVINEKGTCINCNRKFAELMEKQLKNKAILFIVDDSHKMDMSAYYLNESEHVLIDYDHVISELEFIKSCSILKLKNKDIEEITPVTLENIRKVKDGPW